jgi:hypothetical protein
MKDSRVLFGLLAVGFGVMVLSCGTITQSAEPAAAVPTGTQDLIATSASPSPPSPTPEPLSAEVPDHSCPPMTGGGSAIQPHPEQANYSAEIAEYLSEGGSLEGLTEELELLDDLGGQQKVSVIGVDVTGDGQAEVVAESLWFPPGEPVQGYAYVLTCEGGRYVVQIVEDFESTASFADASKNQSLGFRAAEDLTGDGVAEILFSFIETPEMLPAEGGGGYARFFKLVGWDGAGYVELLPEQFPGRPAIAVFNGDGELADRDGDGLKELILRGGAPTPGLGHPLTRTKTATWGWAGSSFALRCISLGAPTYRFQAVEDGDAAMLCQDLDAAIESYQRAIFDESLLAWEGDELGLTPALEDERAVLSAYSRYRLMLVHFFKGTGNAASVVYTSLTEKFPPGSPGGIYAELATAFWNEWLMTAKLPASCAAAIAQADEWGLAPLADSYGYYSALYAAPAYLCPY